MIDKNKNKTENNNEKVLKIWVIYFSYEKKIKKILERFFDLFSFRIVR